jgi:hypothetical protein
MSADSWEVCPRCIRRARTDLEALKASVEQSYGTITREAYEQARSAIKEIDDEDFRTWREEYEFYGAETGTVTVCYGGTCTTCGLELNIDEKYEIPL